MGSVRKPNRYVMLVGVDLYCNDGSRKDENGRPVSINWLHGCVNDVNALRGFFQDQFDLTRLTVLTSTATEPRHPYAKPAESLDALPTFDNIKQEFDAICNLACQGDYFYFHYSGHGALLPRIQASPGGRLFDPSLLPVDYGCGKRAIRGWQLNSWLSQLNRKEVQVVVALDSCYSGGSWRGGRHVRTQDLTTVVNLPIDEETAETVPFESDSRFSRLEETWSINPKGLTLMAACDTDEKAAEITMNGKRHGAFTSGLLKYLEEGIQDKRPRIYRTIRDQLACRVKGQTPRVYGQDRLLFFGKTEPFSTSPLVVRIESGPFDRNTVIVPAGRAHGVHRHSEFALLVPGLETAFSIEEVDDFEARAIVPSQVLR
ncbi:hypothetical protein HIM_11874 [Hirsutella minnesotensis 3608]|uniref:Peptidase C14 caspase domain-containing protein n=1 Tax=Hirsutella minnesotensis 3608 TaxID=1043627 RepID=A0A0F7ZIN6_9HYPO|nr:hypothetical protein HIM_11874 [Hirsutella minnesotensis 3608]